MYNITIKITSYIFDNLITKNVEVGELKFDRLKESFLSYCNNFNVINYNCMKINIYDKSVDYEFLYDYFLTSK